MLTLATQSPKCDSLDGLDLWPESEFPSIVKNMCGLLVTVYGGTLSLIHQAARDFLVVKPGNSSFDRRGQWRGCVDLASAHSLLCQVCVYYLSLGDYAKATKGGDIVTNDDSEKHDKDGVGLDEDEIEWNDSNNEDEASNLATSTLTSWGDVSWKSWGDNPLDSLYTLKGKNFVTWQKE